MRGFQLGEPLPGGVEFAKVVPQHRVHETGLGGHAAAFGHLDSFVDGGVARDSIEPENLVESEAQEDLEFWFLQRAGRLAGDQPVERRLPSNHSANQFMGQPAVGWRKERVGKRLFQNGFHEGFFACLASAQHPGRNFSWFLSTQHL